MNPPPIRAVADADKGSDDDEVRRVQALERARRAAARAASSAVEEATTVTGYAAQAAATSASAPIVAAAATSASVPIVAAAATSAATPIVFGVPYEVPIAMARAARTLEQIMENDEAAETLAQMRNR